MTSKISSVKLLKESVKRNMALEILILVGFFCYFPLGGSLLLRTLERNYETGWYNVDNILETLSVFGSANPFLFVVTFSLALLLGILQFSYLHSQKKLDLYHSIPVRREKFFAIQYLAGILLWLVPFSIGTLIYWFFCEFNGFGYMLASILARGILAHTACFLLVYSLMILAMMLTGKIFTAICGMIVFCAYLPTVKAVQELLMDYYFITYYFDSHYSQPSLLYKSTPVYVCAKVCSELMKYRFPRDLLLAAVLISALLAALCVWLYQRRGSERAGTSMVFPAVARIVKFLIVVPSVLMIATGLRALADGSVLWEIIGWALGLLLVSGFMEFLYCLDIREIFRDKKQLVFTGIVILALLAVVRYDLIGYDQWLPDQSEVESITMLDIDSIGGHWLNEYTEFGRSEDGQLVQYTMSARGLSDDYTFTGERLEDAYELIRHSMMFTEKTFDWETADDERYWGGAMMFQMKDGSKKYRYYSYTKEELQKWFAPVWESDEYKEAMYPVIKVEPEDIIAVQVSENAWIYDDVLVEEDLSAGENETEAVKVEAEKVQTDALESESAQEETIFEEERKDAPAAEADEETPKEENVSGEEKPEEKLPGEETPEEEEIPETDYEEGMEYAMDMGYADMWGGMIEPEVPLTAAQKEKILRTFQNDLRNETMEFAPYYVYVINIVYRGTDGKVYGEEFDLNENYRDTLRVLKECGFDLQ